MGQSAALGAFIGTAVTIPIQFIVGKVSHFYGNESTLKFIVSVRVVQKGVKGYVLRKVTLHF